MIVRETQPFYSILQSLISRAGIDEGVLKYKTDVVREEIDTALSRLGPDPAPYSEDQGEMLTFDLICQEIKKVGNYFHRTLLVYSMLTLYYSDTSVPKVRTLANKDMILELRRTGLQQRFLKNHLYYMNEVLEQTNPNAIKSSHDLESFISHHSGSVGIYPIYPILE